MKAMTPARRFKTREEQTVVTAVAATAEVTRAVATQVAGVIPAEVIRVVVIPVVAILEGVVADPTGDAVIADRTQRLMKGWSS